MSGPSPRGCRSIVGALPLSTGREAAPNSVSSLLLEQRQPCFEVLAHAVLEGESVATLQCVHDGAVFVEIESVRLHSRDTGLHDLEHHRLHDAVDLEHLLVAQDADELQMEAEI